MISKYIRTTSSLAIAIGGLAFASPALAQDASAAQPEASDTDNTLGEIVVTAQRREQRADDVGVTINVLTGSDLKAAGRRSRQMCRSRMSWPIASSMSAYAASA